MLIARSFDHSVTLHVIYRNHIILIDPLFERGVGYS